MVPFDINGVTYDSYADFDSKSDEALEICRDPDYEDEAPNRSNGNDDDLYSIDKKQEIIDFWRDCAKGKKRKTLKHVQHRYRKVPSMRALYRWEKQLTDGE